MGIASAVRSYVLPFVTGSRGVEFVEDRDMLRDDSERNPRSMSAGLDYVACVHWLEHHEAWKEKLVEWWGMLEPGGSLVCVLPDRRLYPKDGELENPHHKVRWELKEFEAAVLPLLEGASVKTHTLLDHALSFMVVFVKSGGAKIGVRNGGGFDVLPDYSVVIPCYKKPELVEACLRSMIEAGWVPARVILQDDDEENTGLPQDYPVSGYPWPVDGFVNSERKGFPYSVNAGVGEVNTPFFICLNSDTIVKPGGDKALLDPLSWPACGISGQTGGKLDRSRRYAGPGDDYVEMYAFAARTSVWDKMGGLDEGFGLGYGEDSDFSLRLKKAGYSIATGADACTHIGNQSFGKSEEVKQLIETNRKRLVSKHPDKRALFVVASVGVSGGIKVIWNCAKALREQGWKTDAFLVNGQWGTYPPQWSEFGLRGNVDNDKYDLVVGTFHNTWPKAASVDAAYHVALVQSDEPEWYSPNKNEHDTVYRNFTTPGFKHIIVAEKMRAFEEKYGHEIVGKIDVCVDMASFYPMGIFREDRPHTMLSIRKGAKVWFDGQEYCDDAARSIACRYPKFKYNTLGGTAALYDGGRKMSCWQNHTTYDENEVRNLYNSAGVYVIPSYIEGNSLTVLEAMACLTPVVATEHASDYVVGGETGLVVPYGDAVAIDDAVSRIFDDLEFALYLSYSGLKVAQRLTAENQRAQFASIIKDHING